MKRYLVLGLLLAGLIASPASAQLGGWFGTQPYWIGSGGWGFQQPNYCGYGNHYGNYGYLNGGYTGGVPQATFLLPSDSEYGTVHPRMGGGYRISSFGRNGSATYIDVRPNGSWYRFGD